MVCSRNTHIDSYVIPDIIGNKISYINIYTIIVYVLVCSTALAISENTTHKLLQKMEIAQKIAF